MKTSPSLREYKDFARWVETLDGWTELKYTHYPEIKSDDFFVGAKILLEKKMAEHGVKELQQLAYGWFDTEGTREISPVVRMKTRIKEYRAKHNLTQEKLADKVRVRRETIIFLKQGEI